MLRRMAENYLTRTTFRAGPDRSAAVSATGPLGPILADYKGSINPGPTPGEVTVLLYFSADGTMAAAAAAIRVIAAAFTDAKKPLPGRLNPVNVEAFKADPPA